MDMSFDDYKRDTTHAPRSQDKYYGAHDNISELKADEQN